MSELDYHIMQEISQYESEAEHLRAIKEMPYSFPVPNYVFVRASELTELSKTLSKINYE